MNRKERRKQAKGKNTDNFSYTANPVISNQDLDQRVAEAFERHKANDYDFAHKVYRDVLAQNPNHPQALHYMGLMAQQMGHGDQAMKLIRRSIQLDNSDATAFDHMGRLYLRKEDYEAAAKHSKIAVDREPENVAFLNNYGNSLKYIGDVDGAVEQYRKVLEISPETAISTYNLANVLKIRKSYDEAIVWFRKTISVEPDHFRARFELAVSLEQKGDFDEAVVEYLEVIRLKPDHIHAMANLIAIKSYKPDEEIVSRAAAMFTDADLKEPEKVKLGYGLGKHYDRTGDFDRAFGYFQTAKDVKRGENTPFDIGQVRSFVDGIIEVYTEEYFAKMRPHGNDTDRPMFIVGMPRSGTTLTEQIIASHPQMFGAGEMKEIPKVMGSLKPDYPFNMAGMGKDEIGEIAEVVLSAMKEVAPDDALRVTDKLPVNFMNLGLIATLFPNARIVHCLREPMDVGISCFIELFNMEQDYSTDLEDFGLYYLEYIRLMDHWRKVLPLPLHEQYYEELIDDQETGIRALVAHSGLNWDEACMNFQDTDRAVMTPSRWQVRQPIYKSSSGRWKNYEKHMEPLRRLLEENGFQYGRK